MTQLNSKRRRFLQGLGVAGAVAVAGCVGNADEGNGNGNGNGNDEEPAGDTEESLPGAKSVDVDRVAADPTDIPGPVDWNEPRHHEISMTTTEVTAEIEPGVTFDYMTFDDQIPGPMIRVRRGDTIHLTLTNSEENSMPHNIDLHAVYGPGGGAEDTTINPGESAEFEFKAMYPGVHVYHCAVPNMDYHISAGMYGAILVEPEGGLPAVDRELYFGQNELYTKGTPGEEGHHAFSFDKMKAEDPTYVTLNGEAYAFTGNGYGPVTVQKGERVRVFFANGGPNLTSALHPIGNVFDAYYREGDLLSEPGRFIETAPVVPGSVAAGEMETPVPGPIKLVDHALTRAARRGMLGVIEVEGEPEPDIYNPNP
ncbi:copper-containing nitrite reductase [Natronosalvus rutilus]|uniref:Copper-containing nitrite reductase n=1 Tax=Natronosalvus rutilus TaxID=2953753 RepID=A0A9E7N8C1_9EURY|nr:copper-containing nitrite reductase [Natronosalvus rutilus]UTF52203.1 copper-containing nitrite reductase [Natronosalvus rutilus]